MPEIDGRRLAHDIQHKVEQAVGALRQGGRFPNLVALQIGRDAATDMYVKRQREDFFKLGIQYNHVQLDPATDLDALISHLEPLNANPKVTGIIVTMPLPESIPAHRAQETINPKKDVEGVHPENLGRLIHNRQAVGPCTALAVLTAIESTEVDLQGKNVVVVGHSDIVGKPVGLCLLQELATITTCHIATRDLAEHTRRADILVAAVGKPELITGDMVQEGAVVIDVGINCLKGRGVVGDVDYDSVAPKAGWITPVPGGIGPLTVAMLARNTLLCARKIFAIADPENF